MYNYRELIKKTNNKYLLNRLVTFTPNHDQ